MTCAKTQPDAPRQRRGADSPGPIARGIRAALWMLIAAAGCYVGYGYSRLWNEWRETAPPIVEQSATNFDAQALAAGLPLEGPWSFAQLDWDICSQSVAAAEVVDRLEKLATRKPGASDEQLPDVSPELVELAESLGAQSVERAGNRMFQLERPNLKARLAVRTVAGKAKVVALAAALPQSHDRWQFFELTPRGSSPVSPIDIAPQLLPFPSGARRDGGRFADDGQVLLELVSLNATGADELLEIWKAGGWEVRPGGVDGLGEFRYLCARGDDVIYAWSADPSHAIKNLMLVRTPSEPDTNSSNRRNSPPRVRVPGASPQ